MGEWRRMRDETEEQFIDRVRRAQDFQRHLDAIRDKILGGLGTPPEILRGELHGYVYEGAWMKMQATAGSEVREALRRDDMRAAGKDPDDFDLSRDVGFYNTKPEVQFEWGKDFQRDGINCRCEVVDAGPAPEEVVHALHGGFALFRAKQFGHERPDAWERSRLKLTKLTWSAVRRQVR